jgi:protein-tyrosine phosphatase
MKRLLFVCTGNICRSPTAEGIARHVITARRLTLSVDSAGTHGYHIGEPPDMRSTQTARRHGVDLSTLRARKIAPDDYHAFDILIAMDRGHLQWLEQRKPVTSRAELGLFMQLAGAGVQDIPDPYYGAQADFDQVFSLLSTHMPTVLENIG